MQRRELLATALSAAALGATGFSPAFAQGAVPEGKEPPDGPVTLYFEFRVAASEHEAMLAALKERASAWRRTPGFSSLLLKQMSGDSTMVKNYPQSYKGVLAEAYLDGVKAGTQPYFYSLFVRFDDYQKLTASGVNKDFDAAILPHLHAFALSPAGPVKSPEPMAVYRGIFQTVICGDRKGIYSERPDILRFLRQPVEHPETGAMTVANHVMLADEGHLALESAVAALLKVAQDTYQPTNDPNGVGQPGASDNRLYRKALSTEILRAAVPCGNLRAYLLHGVWESVMDHENSHLDPRFQAAIAPVAAHVVVGPVEPFYLTRMAIVA